MLTVKGPDFITLLVRDLEISRRFYAEVLGFKSSSETRPNAVAFAAQPISFAIRKSEIDLDAVAELGKGVILWFRTNDATALYNHLKESSISITQDLQDGPFGKMFTFRDPDGYLITVHDGG